MNAPRRNWFEQRRFGDILVRVDTAALGDELPWHALDRIARLALEQGARISLVDVLDPVPAELEGDALANRLAAHAARRAHERLAALAAPLAGLATPDVEVLSGIPFLVTTRLVLRRGHDLVIHLTRSSTAQTGLGADDRHLARKCPCPVWVMDAACDRPYRNVVVAVEATFDGRDDVLDGFALQLSQTAALFAALDAATVHVVHAWQPFGAALLDDPALGLDRASRTAYVARQRERHRASLAAICRALDDRAAVAPRARLIDGPADEVIPRCLADLHADLLVMGTVAGGNTPGLFIGNAAENILGRIAIPVLVLKPPGFESPVRLVPTTPALAEATT